MHLKYGLLEVDDVFERRVVCEYAANFIMYA